MELDAVNRIRSRGFTLTELLVALSLLSVLLLLAGLLMASARSLARALGGPDSGPEPPLAVLREDLFHLLRTRPGEDSAELRLDPRGGLRFQRMSRDADGWMYAEELHIPPLADGTLLRVSRPAGDPEGAWVTNRIRSGLKGWRLLAVSEEEVLEEWPPPDRSGTAPPPRLLAEWVEEDGGTRSGSLLIPTALRYKPE